MSAIAERVTRSIKHTRVARTSSFWRCENGVLAEVYSYGNHTRTARLIAEKMLSGARSVVIDDRNWGRV